MEFQSLNDRYAEVMEHILAYHADIVFLTETWQKSMSNSTTAALKEYGYTLHHSIRKHDTKKRGSSSGLLCSSKLDI